MKEETFLKAQEIRKKISTIKGRMKMANSRAYFHAYEANPRGAIGHVEAAERYYKKAEEHANEIDKLRKEFEKL